MSESNTSLTLLFHLSGVFEETYDALYEMDGGPDPQPVSEAMTDKMLDFLKRESLEVTNIYMEPGICGIVIDVSKSPRGNGPFIDMDFLLDQFQEFQNEAIAALQKMEDQAS